MPEPVLLDTHVALWWVAGAQQRLSDAALSVLESDALLHVSPVSCWEIGMLVERGRVALDREVHDWVDALLAHERVELAALVPRAAVAAAQLPDFHGDPADRMLWATAAQAPLRLLTKDRRLRAYAEARPGDVTVVW